MDFKNTSTEVEVVTAKITFSTSGPQPREKVDFMIQTKEYNTFVKKVNELKKEGYEQTGPIGYMTFKNETYLALTLVKPE